MIAKTKGKQGFVTVFIIRENQEERKAVKVRWCVFIIGRFPERRRRKISIWKFQF